MLKEIGRLFSCWHAFLDFESASREELWQATTLIRARMKRLYTHYAASQDSSVRTRVKRFLKIWDHLFIFLRHEGVEPQSRTSAATSCPVAKDLLWVNVRCRRAMYRAYPEHHPDLSYAARNLFDYLADLVTASFRNESPTFAFSRNQQLLSFSPPVLLGAEPTH